MSVVEHKTYTSLFSDATCDPFGAGASRTRSILRYSHAWRTDNNPHTVAELEPLVYDYFADHPIGGIGVFIVDGNAVLRLKVLVGLKKYSRNPRSMDSVLYNLAFAYVGDVEEGMGEMIQFDTDCLDTTAEINVFKIATYKSKLVADPSLELFPPVDDADAQNETLKVRKSAFIPYCLMQYVLDKDLTPREAFLLLHPLIENAGMVDACSTLLDWLRVAGTMPSPSTVPLVGLDVPGKAVRIERPLLKFIREQVLLRDLEGMRPKASATTDPLARQMERAVTTLTEAHLRTEEANERRRFEKDKPKNVEDQYVGALFEKLCFITGTPKERIDELPGLYSRIAQQKKKESLHSIIQQTIDNHAQKFDMIEGPIVSTGSMQLFKTLRFQGVDEQDLGSGILPMSLTPPGAVSSQARAQLIEDNENALTYEFMMSTDGQQISSSDAKLLSKTKGYVPTEWSEAKAQVEAYQPVITAILGELHPTALEYICAVKYASTIFLSLKQALEDKVGKRQGPAMYVYIFHSSMHGWFREQYHTRYNVPPPELVSDFRRFSMRKNLEWLPNVSDIEAIRSLKMIDSAVAPRSPSKKATAAPNSGIGTRVSNPFWDSRFKLDNEFCTAVKERAARKIIGAAKSAGKSFPMTEEGKERCITWHSKGYCGSSCKQAYDHKEIETPELKDELYDFVRAGCA
jgi:hypothetical protein